MSRLAVYLRMSLFEMLRELDECDLSKLFREAQEMVETNRELKSGREVGADCVGDGNGDERKSRAHHRR